MPLPDDLRDHMDERDAAAAADAKRETRRDLARTALACLAWCALGLGLVAWALHATDEGYGRIAFFAGIAVGDGGIVFTLLGAWRRGEQRGDW